MPPTYPSKQGDLGWTYFRKTRACGSGVKNTSRFQVDGRRAIFHIPNLGAFQSFLVLYHNVIMYRIDDMIFHRNHHLKPACNAAQVFLSVFLTLTLVHCLSLRRVNNIRYRMSLIRSPDFVTQICIVHPL